jgi:hypothetical protein
LSRPPLWICSSVSQTFTREDALSTAPQLQPQDSRQTQTSAIPAHRCASLNIPAHHSRSRSSTAVVQKQQYSSAAASGKPSVCPCLPLANFPLSPLAATLFSPPSSPLPNPLTATLSSRLSSRIHSLLSHPLLLPISPLGTTPCPSLVHPCVHPAQRCTYLHITAEAGAVQQQHRISTAAAVQQSAAT